MCVRSQRSQKAQSELVEKSTYRDQKNQMRQEIVKEDHPEQNDLRDWIIALPPKQTTR